MVQIKEMEGKDSMQILNPGNNFLFISFLILMGLFCYEDRRLLNRKYLNCLKKINQLETENHNRNEMEINGVFYEVD